MDLPRRLGKGAFMIDFALLRRPVAQVLLAAALAAAGCGTAHAQLVLDGKTLSIETRELAALTRLRETIPGHEPRLQDNALAAPRRIVESHDGLYVLALYEEEIGKQRSDGVLRTQALDVLIASEMTPRERLPSFLAVRGNIAFQAGDFATANTMWTRQLAMKPGDPDVTANLAQVRVAQNDPKGATELLDQAIAARTAAHQPVSEILYRQAMSTAYQGGMVEKGVAAAHALVRAYPGPGNWRDALVVYRQLVQPQGPLEIDLMRLMRATGSLTRDAEYQRMAQLLEQAGLLAEARAVMADGVSRDVLDPLDPHTHAINAEIDRRTQQPARPVTPDASVAETQLHLGETLAQAGRRDEARAAFRLAAAQPGGHADLALFWLDWLAH
jgi:tetratricopeptide (TPR) repeat protein